MDVLKLLFDKEEEKKRNQYYNEICYFSINTIEMILN